jgi:hypothetical protein
VLFLHAYDHTNAHQNVATISHLLFLQPCHEQVLHLLYCELLLLLLGCEQVVLQKLLLKELDLLLRGCLVLGQRRVSHCSLG